MAAITNWMVIGDRMFMKFGNEQEHKKSMDGWIKMKLG